MNSFSVRDGETDRSIVKQFNLRPLHFDFPS
jgi:hypothetical protein